MRGLDAGVAGVTGAGLCEVVDWAYQSCEQVLDLVAGQGDQAVWVGSVAAFGGRGDGEEGVGEHCEVAADQQAPLSEPTNRAVNLDLCPAVVPLALRARSG